MTHPIWMTMSPMMSIEFPVVTQESPAALTAGLVPNRRTDAFSAPYRQEDRHHAAHLRHRSDA